MLYKPTSWEKHMLNEQREAKIRSDPSTYTGFHFPGDNYLGPGTNIRNKIYGNFLPTTRNDYVARQHDIDYIGDHEPIYGDIKAIIKSGPGWDGVAMRLGLGFRTVADAVLYPFGLHKLTHVNRSINGNKYDDERLRAELEQYIGGNA